MDMNVDPHPTTQTQALEHLQAETKRWGEVIQRAGIAKQ
jgi:hypothetical protein